MNKKIYIFGAGQVGLVALSILRDAGIKVFGFLDDDSSKKGGVFGGLIVHGGRELLTGVELFREQDSDILVCIGLGDIKARKNLFDLLGRYGIQSISAIHPSAIISKEFELGINVIVGPGCVFFGNSRLGNGCYVGPNVTISHDSKVGDFSLLSVGSVIGARVEIGTGVFVGTGSTLLEPKFGPEARLLVGDGAIVGAGSLVLAPVFSNSTVVGRPAKVHLKAS
jgi:sugar O-acyltransferase (sialic acid O-acetyltransferase NeuD family)